MPFRAIAEERISDVGYRISEAEDSGVDVWCGGSDARWETDRWHGGAGWNLALSVAWGIG